MDLPASLIDPDAPLIDLHSPEPAPLTAIHENNSLSESEPECPICLSISTFPVCLPCAHVFCFLCAKGALNGNRACPLCRRPVPLDYFNNPQLLHKPTVPPIDRDHQRWCYAGDSGWWLYDQQHSEEIEQAFVGGVRQMDLQIADHVYVIDFVRMVQYRKRDPRRARRIRRAEPGEVFTTKGIAGIKCPIQNDLLSCSPDPSAIIGDSTVASETWPINSDQPTFNQKCQKWKHSLSSTTFR